MFIKIKLCCILIISLIILIFAFPQPFFQEPQALAESEEKYGPEQYEEVFTAVVNSFARFSSLINDVYYHKESVYPVVTSAYNIKEATEYLKTGFQVDIAANIANCYLGWDEELARLVVIPTDSIPLITNADQQESSIVFINENHAVLQRSYQKCYTEQDNYIYTIHVIREESGWKISELSLEETN